AATPEEGRRKARERGVGGGAAYVLVCESTDPSWTPLFINAAAIVLECGGALSHGAVVARELAKPAVVLPNATQLFKEGQTLTVDGTSGAVHCGTATASAVEAPVNPNDTRIAHHRLPPAPGG